MFSVSGVRTNLDVHYTLCMVNKLVSLSIRMLLKLGTGNGERGTGNGERESGNGERGTGVWERVYSGIQNGGGNDVYKHWFYR